MQPLEDNLDVAGLKEQVLGRLETLEQREREREELLAELVPLMKASGYETGSLRMADGWVANDGYLAVEQLRDVVWGGSG